MRMLPTAPGRPLATTLPHGVPTLYWAVEGVPAPQALRVSVDGSVWSVEAASVISEAGSPDDAAAPRAASSATASTPAPGALLPSDPLTPESARVPRRVVASVVDWRSSYAYAALSAPPQGRMGAGVASSPHAFAAGASVVQLAITFFLAQAFMIAKLINGMINTVGGNVNSLLDQKLGAVCKEIFGVILGGIKKEMLALMKKMAKLEGPLKKLPKVPGF